MDNLALYIHWPFCRAKCPYCDFNSHVREKIDQERWQKALLTELKYFAEKISPRRLTSIFFGGGTPSLMEPVLIENIIHQAANIWSFASDIEITLEANPNSAEQQKFKDFHKAGINRLSLGVQSFDETSLRFLGRLHNAEEAKRAIGWAAAIFPRFTFDLIYSRPGQSQEEWEKELTIAFSYQPHHLSLYQLTIEKGTTFEQAYDRGDMVMPEEEESLALFSFTHQRMKQAGLPAYEISNFARPGEESRHNLTYWRYGDYLGIGPGAHSRLSDQGTRIALRQHRAPEIWLERVESAGHATQERHILSDLIQHEERVMMGLRLNEGIEEKIFSENVLQPLIEGGWLERKAGHICLTDAGRPLINAILQKLIAN